MPNVAVLFVAIGLVGASAVTAKLAMLRLIKLKVGGPLEELARHDGEFRYAFRTMAFLAGGYRQVGDPRVSLLVTLYWVLGAVGFLVFATYAYLVLRATGEI